MRLDGGPQFQKTLGWPAALDFNRACAATCRTVPPTRRSRALSVKSDQTDYCDHQ